MKTVHKYPVEMRDGVQKVEMSKGGQILHLGLQKQKDDEKESLCFWALVDTDMPKETRTFHVIGTGYELPSVICMSTGDASKLREPGERLKDIARHYLGTMLVGDLVHLVFEEEVH